MCDLFLLASSILCLLGQFLRDAGNLHVGVPFDQETTIKRARDNGFFVVCTRKKKVLITRQGEKWRGHMTTSLEGESPSSSMGLVCPEEEPTPSCGSQGQYGSLTHCLESPPQRKSGRLWRSAQRHHAKQKVTLTNCTCPIQTHHQWQELLLHSVLERNCCVHNTILLGVFSPYSEP